MLTSFSQFLTEGKVLDDAIAIAKKSIREYYTTGPGSRIELQNTELPPEERKPALIARFQRDVDIWFPTITQYFQKRPGVPNPNWMNWVAKNPIFSMEDMNDEDLEHFSDFMMRDNRMANWDFNRFVNWEHALGAMDDLQTAYYTKKKGTENYSSAAFTSLSNTLDDAEREELGKRKSHSDGEVLVPGENAKVIVDCGGGWKWFDLDKGFCEREGRSMMHCGNVNGKTRPEETIFSLRHEVDGKWAPFLTFVYNKKYASLGEMKASGNRKPSKFFHPMIMKLLNAKETTDLGNGHVMTGPLIRNITGGGYAPQRNFSLNDLTADQREEVFSVPGRPKMKEDWEMTNFLDHVRFGNQNPPR